MVKYFQSQSASHRDARLAEGSIKMNENEYAPRRAWMTSALIAVNILCFLYLEIAGSSEDVKFMLEHGAMYTPLVLEEHEYYRLFTAMFMHFGIEHLVNNMLVLFVLGDNLERALGKIRYLIFYLLCGVGSNFVSMIVHMGDAQQYVGAGASGAIFGVIGGLLYIVARNRGRLEDLSSRQLVVTILFSLYFGYTSTGVDNVAHISGLVIGIILGLIFYRKQRNEKDRYEL